MPVNTPFKDDGSIDESAWCRIIEHLIAEGVHGLIVGGTTGEFYALTQAERLQQFARAEDAIDRRLPWLAGVNDFTTEGAAHYAARARQAGADGLLVAAPPHSQPTGQELASPCLAIDAATGLPIMLYNHPGRSGTSMGEEFLACVGHNRNFAAIKERSEDVDRPHLLARGFSHVQLSCGADDRVLEFFAWGARSWVCAAGNCLIGETIALYDACVVRGEFETGRRIMAALMQLMITLERGGKFVRCVNDACERRGLPAGAVRSPLRPLGAELKRRMRQVLEIAKTAISRIRCESERDTDQASITRLESVSRNA